ncbi:carbohydrate ABC transporter permease [Mesobacillus foraminis]|jgi:putative aldouronate transport system permease protein|uniref:carbohydrate ABC transporter permease n=1 Tax=Mesobacillus foraminis TaxID=279826 RepID=UPI000EF4BB40|nr:carbohydrate ABC transporter permease [Mesobacillus foraminis]MBT2758162.1 carbohydrate ABC transporter permease [Mesobacillus foraminis]
MKETSLSGRIFDSFNILFMILLCLTTLYPFLYLATLSLSPSDVSFSQIRIFPEKISFDNFEQVLGYDQVLTGFINSVKRTVIGTFLNVFVTIAAAYVLAKNYFPHRAFWTKFIVITMFFQGGMIPSYLLIKDLGLMNSMWALILPVLVNPFQLIIARNFMQSLPAELEEAAKVDGANDIYILLKIIIPISMPIIATLGLWNAVFHWNSWFDSLIYMTDPENSVLQMVMRRIVLDGQMEVMSSVMPEDMKKVNTETIKAATVMVTTIPIILIYPFVQKYFVKGMLIGSVKG